MFLLTDRRCLEGTQSDYVIFSNFNVNLIDRKMSPLCGTAVITGRTVEISDGNFFRVSFKSNDVFDATGFSAYYEFRQFQGKNEPFIDIRLRPCLATPLAPYGPLRPNVLLSIKSEVHNISQRRQRRTEPRPHGICAKIVKIGPAVPDMCSWTDNNSVALGVGVLLSICLSVCLSMCLSVCLSVSGRHTDRQTGDRHTDRHIDRQTGKLIAIHDPLMGQSNNK